MKHTLIFWLALCPFLTPIWAQKSIVDSVYTYEKLNRSLSFAQLTFGGDLLCLSGGSVSRTTGTQAFQAGVIPRLTLGGLHFWGHADFYVTFPVGLRWQVRPAFADKILQEESVETGLKIYPFALRPGRIRPYVGISFQPFHFGYQLKGLVAEKGYVRYERFINPIQAGLTYASPKYLFTAGLRYNTKRSFSYYEGPNTESAVRLRGLNFSLGLVRYIDTDKGTGSPKSVDQQNIMLHLLKKSNKLSAWYWGIGPSTALQMSKSPYIQANYPYLENDLLNAPFVPDVTLGRYFSEIDANLGISSRMMWFSTAAFDTRLRMRRISASFEAYKFLFNYHGFVPFIGPMLSMEHLRLKTNGTRTAQGFQPAWGLVFGWDIRVTRTGTSLLRTNLRYFPNLHMTVADKKVMFNHLEFNFIQYVHFIGRKKFYQQYTRK